MTRAAVLLVWMLLAPAAGAAQDRSAQSGTARVVAFTNEPREPEFGEVFELEVQVRIAPDMVAFLSDTMAEASSSVSAGPGSWTLSEGPADSVDVRATYPVMGLLPGGVELPFVEIWTRPATTGEEPGVHVSAALGEEERNLPGVEYARLYLGGIFVMPPSEMVGDDATLMPRPPADVLGGEVSPWLVGVIILVLGAAVTVGWLALRGRGGSDRATVPLPLSPRAEALRELDRIRETGWQANGRVADFYEATTGVLRRYAERRDPERMRTALTSSELLDRLRGRWGEDSVEALGSSVWNAECVKFGGRRPGPEVAEQDWARVRAWIAEGPGGS